MPRSSRRETDHAAVATAIPLGIYCLVAACFAFGLYELMQPKRLDNPGLAVYKPASRPAINFTSPTQRLDPPDAISAAIEPDVETIGASALQSPAEAKKPNRGAKTKASKRQRAAHRKERRDPMMDYALQPFLGGHRPWY
jgi:hypothetical protein